MPYDGPESQGVSFSMGKKLHTGLLQTHTVYVLRIYQYKSSTSQYFMIVTGKLACPAYILSRDEDMWAGLTSAY